MIDETKRLIAAPWNRMTDASVMPCIALATKT